MRPTPHCSTLTIKMLQPSEKWVVEFLKSFKRLRAHERESVSKKAAISVFQQTMTCCIWLLEVVHMKTSIVNSAHSDRKTCHQTSVESQKHRFHDAPQISWPLFKKLLPAKDSLDHSINFVAVEKEGMKRHKSVTARSAKSNKIM